MNAYDANNLTETFPANRLFYLLSGGKTFDITVRLCLSTSDSSACGTRMLDPGNKSTAF